MALNSLLYFGNTVEPEQAVAFMDVCPPKSYPKRLDCSVEEFKDIYPFSEKYVEWLAAYFLGNKIQQKRDV